MFHPTHSHGTHSPEILLGLSDTPRHRRAVRRIQAAGFRARLIRPEELGPEMDAGAIVVLPTRRSPESGWLLAAKLLAAVPEQPVILIARERTPRRVRLAEYIGAAEVVAQSDGVSGLLAAIRAHWACSSM